MTDATDVDDDGEETGKKGSKIPLVLGVVLAIVGGAGGFFATQMGLLPFGTEPSPEEVVEEKPLLVTEDVSFVQLEPITVSLPPGGERSFIRLSVQLDVAPENAVAVEAIKPRIVDILNTYLRAIDVNDLESSTALLRLRTQMLHRVQVVAGPGIVRDLLVTEFIIN